MVNEISLEQLKTWAENFSAPGLTQMVEDLTKAGISAISVNDLTEKFGKTAVDTWRNTSAAIVDATKNADEFFGALLNKDSFANSFMNSLSSGMTRFAEENDIATDGIATFGVTALMAIEPFFGIVPDAAKNMGKLGGSAYDTGASIKTAFDGTKGALDALTAPLGKVGDALVSYIGKSSEGAAQAAGMQREIISLAAAQGSYNEIMGEANQSVANLNQRYLGLVDTAHISAAATGHTVASMMDLIKTMRTIPEVTDTAIMVGEKHSNQLVVATQLATAYGKTHESVGTDLSAMYTNLGISGEKAFESLANIYAQAGDSKLRMEEFTKLVLNSANNFKLLGDNTAATTNIIKSFDNAFKDSDIGPAGIQKVVEGLVSGLDKMDLAQKAFVSGATGGPGGLAGAFQMDYAIQTGNIDEVLRKTMEAMQQQFSGPILTLKEAAENPELSGEFYKQVSFLKDVAGIAGSDREAYRMLEAMQSGVTDQIQLGTARDEDGGALESAVERGTEIQNAHTPILMGIHQEVEKFNLLQSAGMLYAQNEIGDSLGKLGVATELLDVNARSENFRERSNATGFVGADNEFRSAGDLIRDLTESETLNNLYSAIKDKLPESALSILGMGSRAEITEKELKEAPFGAAMRSPAEIGAGYPLLPGSGPLNDEIKEFNNSLSIPINNFAQSVQEFRETQTALLDRSITIDPITIKVEMPDGSFQTMLVKAQESERQRAVIGRG